ncbi:MAG: aspartate aminotransferase family protein [Actinomycetota bacterium]
MTSHPQTALWHPFADMAAVSAKGELVLASGEGAYVTDESGRRYLDASAGLWYCNVGHGRTRIAEAAAGQMSTLAAYSAFGDLATRPALDLAERLSALAPMSDAKVFLTSGGSDSVDTAVKLVRRYWAELGSPHRNVIVTRTHAYHGMHLAGTSLAGIPANRQGHGDLDPAVLQIDWSDADALIDLLDQRDDVAAFFCEPIIGAGGVYAPPEGYLDRVRKACRERDVLFVADEVISGYGRAGAMFALTRWSLDPDVLLSAKGVTSGYVPLGAVLVSGRVAEPFWTPGPAPVMWRHGYTYSAHAAGAAAAMANLDILDDEHLVDKAATLQHSLARALSPLTAFDVVSEVRAGVGVLAAVDFTPDAIAEGVPPRVLNSLRERGVLTRTLASGAVQVSPSFVITDADLGLLASALEGALEAVGSSRTPRPALDVTLLPDITSDEGFDPFDDRHYLDQRPPHHA